MAMNAHGIDGAQLRCLTSKKLLKFRHSNADGAMEANCGF